MPVYMIIEAKVKNRGLYLQYLSKVPETISRFEGRYLSRGNKVTPLGADWKPERIILLEFRDEESIHDWLASPEYRAIAPLREAGADTRAVIVEGSVD
jgi:uncharacterized protein (DUF1330 family)